MLERTNALKNLRADRARESRNSRGNAFRNHRVAGSKFSPAFYKRRRGVGAEPQLGLRRGRNACACKKRRRGQREPVPPGPGALRGTHAPGGVPRAGGFDMVPAHEKRCSAGSCFASAGRRAASENPPAKKPARRSQPGKQSGGLFSRACGGHAPPCGGQARARCYRLGNLEAAREKGAALVKYENARYLEQI